MFNHHPTCWRLPGGLGLLGIVLLCVGTLVQARECLSFIVIVDAVRDGEMLATLVQDSERMARLAVSMADTAIRSPASRGQNILLPPFVLDRQVLRNAR